LQIGYEILMIIDHCVCPYVNVSQDMHSSKIETISVCLRSFQVKLETGIQFNITVSRAVNDLINL